jgi:hypothetical protein
MQLGEILDGTFNIYRRHFLLFMRLSLILVWLPAAFWVYVQVRLTGTPTEVLSLLEQHLGTTILVGLAWVIVASACGLLLRAGTIRIISDSYLGHEPDLLESLRFGVGKIIPLLLVTFSKNILFFLVAVLGSLAVVLVTVLSRLGSPAIAALLSVVGFVGLLWFVVWVACGYGTTTPIVVLEELPSSFDAFGRSWELTRGMRGKVFGTMAVTWLISALLPGVVVAAISGAVDATGNAALKPVFIVLTSLISIALAPILPCALTLLYYDLRVRREAFDLQILSQQLGIH